MPSNKWTIWKKKKHQTHIRSIPYAGCEHTINTIITGNRCYQLPFTGNEIKLPNCILENTCLFFNAALIEFVHRYENFLRLILCCVIIKMVLRLNPCVRLIDTACLSCERPESVRACACQRVYGHTTIYVCSTKSARALLTFTPHNHICMWSADPAPPPPSSAFFARPNSDCPISNTHTLGTSVFTQKDGHDHRRDRKM